MYLEYLFEGLYSSKINEEARKRKVSEAGCAVLGESVAWAVAPSPSPLASLAPSPQQCQKQALEEARGGTVTLPGASLRSVNVTPGASPLPLTLLSLRQK